MYRSSMVGNASLTRIGSLAENRKSIKHIGYDIQALSDAFGHSSQLLLSSIDEGKAFLILEASDGARHEIASVGLHQSERDPRFISATRAPCTSPIPAFS